MADVNAPSPASFAPPILSFQQFANWSQPDPYAQVFKQQQEQLNAAKVQQAQQQTALSKAFPDGLPTDPRTGAIDYGQVARTLAKFGDIGGAVSLIQNQPAPLSPMFGGAGQPQGGAPVAPAGPAPSSVPAQPIAAPPAAPAAPRPDPSGGTVSALALSVGAPSTVAQNVARAIGVDPGAPLSDAQQQRASSLLQGYATRQSGAGLERLQSAIFGQESGSGRNTQTSVTGARGGMQIEPGTFKQYATAGENIDNPADNQAVGNRIIADYWKRYNGDPARAAVAYFSGPGNVAPPGSPTPWKKDSADPTGKTTSSYVNDVLRKMGVGQLRQAMEPANPRVAEEFNQLPPSLNAVSPRPSPGGSPSGGAAGAAGAPAAALSSAPSGVPAPQPQQVAQQPVQPAQQPVQAQQQQPIGFQVPLPNDPRTGRPFTDPQQAVLALRAESARLSQYPRAAGQVAQLNGWAQQIEQSIKPIPMRPGETLIEPRSGRVLAQGQPTNANNIALQRFLEAKPDATPEEIQSFIQSGRAVRSAPAMAVQAFQRDFERQNGRPPSADEVTKFAMDYSRQQSYGRAAGTQGARVENASNEVVQLIPQAVEASKNLPRTKWVPFNQLVQKWDQGISDPAYNDFMMANFSLLNAYTRAMNPQGTPRIQERLEQHAMGVLSTATDEKSYEVQIRRLWKEVQASKKATAETAKGVTPGDINAPVPGLDNNGAAATPASGGWTTLPNGARIREVQ